MASRQVAPGGASWLANRLAPITIVHWLHHVGASSLLCLLLLASWRGFALLLGFEVHTHRLSDHQVYVRDSSRLVFCSAPKTLSRDSIIRFTRKYLYSEPL